MEVRVGYKQTEAGVIPDDWRVEPIEKVATVGRGRVISHKEIARSRSSLYPVYSSQTSNDGVMGYLDSFEFEGEYITWTTDGANAGTVFHREGRFNCTNVCGTLKVHSDDARFVARVLSKAAPHHVSRHLGNPKLMNDVMKRVVVPLPPLPEQRAIAVALSDVDALIGGLDRLIAKKRDLKQAAMQQLLTGETRLPGFRGERELKRLGEVAELHRGSGLSKGVLVSSGKRPCILYGELFTTYGRRIIAVVNRTDASDGLPSVAGDVLIPGSTTTSGSDLATASALLESGVALGGDINVIRMRGTSYDAVFLANYLTLVKREQIAELTQGITIHHLYSRDLADLTVELPSVAEQSAIAAVISDMDAELWALEARREKTRGLEQAMTQELLTGRTRLA